MLTRSCCDSARCCAFSTPIAECNLLWTLDATYSHRAPHCRMSSSSRGAGKQILVTLRHALRQDEIDSGQWAFSAERPWDPPLAPEGVQQARAVVSRLPQHRVHCIVCSPFLRCLQTAAEVFTALPEPKPSIEIDCSLSEVMSTAFLAGQGPHTEQTTREWMWSGRDIATVWPDLAGSGPSTVADTDFPSFPETYVDAHVRYTEALQRAADRHPDGNVLVVSHGEAVGKSVTRILPYVSVFLVDHCGFTVASRARDSQGEWEFWKLEEKTGSSGVQWSKR